MTSAPDTVQQAPSSSTNRAAPPSTSTSSAAVPAPAQAPTKPTSRYIETSAKNIIAREAIISGSHFIVLGGKCLIHGGAILRADLRRSQVGAAAVVAAAVDGAGAAAGGKGAAGGRAERGAGNTPHIVISMGRYCSVGEGSVVRPPYKIYQGIFSYYPTKLGDHVTVGPNTVLEAQTVGNYVDIGANCVIGRFVNIKDCARILDGTVLAPNTVVPSLTIWAGSPGKQVAELHESFQDECETRNRRNLREFSRALRAGEPGT
ncbi:unnamed protein product [Tilletia controversa]|uniref:Dynactin subunit 5 n=5 Tax=Tilletia TaxID=13289 RepID=A0A8X7SXN2_9BASI|nr:hypothetical protein A4X06_0g3557 [Tilletia controversa]CAD6935062.1 unnamed protein product [Tilletia controversa]